MGVVVIGRCRLTTESGEAWPPGCRWLPADPYGFPMGGTLAEKPADPRLKRQAGHRCLGLGLVPLVDRVRRLSLKHGE